MQYQGLIHAQGIFALTSSLVPGSFLNGSQCLTIISLEGMRNAGSQALPETQSIWAEDPERCAITTLGNVMLVNVQEQLCIHTACSHFGVFAWLVLNPMVSNVMCKAPAKCPQVMPASHEQCGLTGHTGGLFCENQRPLSLNHDVASHRLVPMTSGRCRESLFH